MHVNLGDQVVRRGKVTSSANYLEDDGDDDEVGVVVGDTLPQQQQDQSPLISSPVGQ